MSEVLFYHLTRAPAEEVLADLARRALAQGWRVTVRGRDRARMEWLDGWLWLHPDDGFLPHGLAGGPHDARQPVLLTTSTEAPNRPDCLAILDGAPVEPGEAAALQRLWILFDGADAAAMEGARGMWKRFRDAGISPQYWSQESGRWRKERG